MTMWNDGTNKDYIAHHGIKGQKWGERRFQYEDGTLTPAGKQRYGYGLDYSNTKSNKFHARKKLISKSNDSNKSTTVTLGKLHSKAPVAGKFYIDSSVRAFNEANRKKLLSNVDSVVDMIYNTNSPYSAYYSKEEFANDLKSGLSNYPTGTNNYTQDVIEEVIGNILEKAERKIKVREKAESVKDRRDPAKTYFLLKNGPGRM